MNGFGFVSCHILEEQIPTGLRRGQDPGSFVDSHNVIGRDKEKAAILEKLLHKSTNVQSNLPQVIVIVGIGGIGKTTLAQLVYNNSMVEQHFEKRWFACISDTSDDKEVIGKIFQSIREESYSRFTVSQLQNKIRESVERKEFLLVLDDVWDDHRGRWQDRMSLLRGGARGSKIIVTTRSLSVVTAVHAFETFTLEGLSQDDSWDLFKRLAFDTRNENDPRRNALGREIVKKCRNVPLAIKSIASLLSEKNTITEWESIRNEELPRLGERHEDGIMPVLKLSYDHLCSNLKQCFAYCSLFPKNDEIGIKNLIYVWIAQGYISTNSEEEGHLCFMYLLRRGFFQQAKEDDDGEIERCKMHDLIHDLAQHVAGEESIMLTPSSTESKCARHVSVGESVDESWVIPTPLMNANRLRSFWLMGGGSISRLVLDQLFGNYNYLRTLNLQSLGIENVCSSIGKLKHLRYLNLSKNKFESLPDSTTNLLNLVVLNLGSCDKLKALPDSFRKLMNLRCFNIRECHRLRHMPPGIGELSELRYLSDLKVGVKGSGPDALARLQHLRGEVSLEFDDGEDDCHEDECWQVPVGLRKLKIIWYPGRRIPRLGLLPNLKYLHLSGGFEVTYMPPFGCLPNLRSLYLEGFDELEYMEEEAASSTKATLTFFPRLEKLSLWSLDKLKGWHRKKAAAAAIMFPLLSQLDISECPEFKFIPPCPNLQKLSLYNVDGEGIPQLLSTPVSTTPSPSLQKVSIFNCKGLTSFSDEEHTYLREFNVERCDNLTILNLTSQHLHTISIHKCHGLRSFHVEALPSLVRLRIDNSKHLKILYIAHLNSLESLKISGCPELVLWEEDEDNKCQLNWESFPKLRWLTVDTLPPLEKLPECLRHRQALGMLHI